MTVPEVAAALRISEASAYRHVQNGLLPAVRVGGVIRVRCGVPVTDLAAHLGHARKSMTLDTYSHVLLDASA